MDVSAGRLSDDEVEKYRHDGFLVPRFRLEGAELAKLQRLTEDLVADNPAEDGYGAPHLGSGGPLNLKTTTDWMDITTHPAILDCLEQLIGPDIILWQSTMFYKIAEKGVATPWHRDAIFYPITPLETATVWVAVYDSTVENGCLRIVPGSHRARQVGDHADLTGSKAFKGELREREFDAASAECIELKAGEMVIFDVFAVHGGEPNTSRKVRAGYAMRYMPASSFYDHDSTDRRLNVAGGVERRLILVRGRDRAGNDFTRGDYPNARIPASA